MEFQHFIFPTISLLLAAVVFGVRLEGKYNALKERFNGEHNTMAEKLISANWRVDHLTLEGIKLKEDMANGSNDITEIKGMQREMANNIIDIKKYIEQK